MTYGTLRHSGLRVKLTSMDKSSSRSPEVVIRRVRPGDQSALRGFYADLAPETRRARFLGYVPGVSDATSRSFCTPDHMHGEGFVALRRGPGGEAEMIGHLCLEPAAKGRLELAVAVSDADQARGIGRGLMEAALRWAAEHGTAEVVATAFAGNSRVLRLLSSAPYGAQVRAADGGLVDVVIPLAPPDPPDLTVPVPAKRPSHGRPAGRVSVRRGCRVVWRRMRLPVRASGD